MDECVCVYGANVLSLVQSSPPLRERVVSAVSQVGAAGGWRGSSGAVRAGRSAKELLMTLPCPSAQTVSKYNSQYHKLFQCVPKDELLMKGTWRRKLQQLRTLSHQFYTSSILAVLLLCAMCHLYQILLTVLFLFLFSLGQKHDWYVMLQGCFHLF